MMRKKLKFKPLTLILLIIGLYLIGSLSLERIQVADTINLELNGDEKVLCFQNYDFLITYAEDAKQIDVEVSANIEILKDRVYQVQFLLANFYQIKIHSLTIDDQPVDYQYSNDLCQIQLPFSCFKGKKLALKMKYSITRLLASNYVKAELRGNWYPKNILPEMTKAKFKLIVPKGTMGIANGKLTEVTELSPNQTVFQWEMNSAATSLGVSLGQYSASSKMVADQFFHIYSIPAYDSNYRKKILNQAIEISSVYRQYFGGKKFEGMSIVINDTQGEEAAFGSLIFLHHNNIKNEESNFFNLAHEISHYWWGNLIMPKTIYDWWIVEGFANYSAFLVTEILAESPDLGRIPEPQKILTNWREQYFDSVYNLNQYQVPELSLAEISPLDSQRNLLYNKGAYVLHMLRKMIGDESFNQYLKEIISEYSLKYLGVRDFTRIGVANYGAELMDFFRQWVYSTGYYNLAINKIDITEIDDEFIIEIKIINNGQLSMPDFIELEIITNEMIYPEILHFNGVNVTIQKTLKHRPEGVKINSQNNILEIFIDDNYIIIN